MLTADSMGLTVWLILSIAWVSTRGELRPSCRLSGNTVINQIKSKDAIEISRLCFLVGAGARGGILQGEALPQSLD